MFADPIKNLKAFDLRETDIVADIGAGTGYYTIAAGHIVTHGKVYAVELHKEYVATINNKIRDAKLTNVETLLGNAEKLGGTKIGDGVLNAVIISNVLFQVEEKDNFVLEVKRILKTKGRALLIDWSEVSALGPKHLVTKEVALKLFNKHGFTLEREINAGEHHYGMILIKEA